MDPIAPVARSEENPAEPARREETASRSNDKNNSIGKSRSPPQKQQQQQQQRSSHASVATSQTQTQVLKITQRRLDSDSTGNGSGPVVGGDGNDRISHELPLVVQKHQAQMQMQAQVQAQLRSNSLHHSNNNSSTIQRAPQSSFQSQMHHQSSVLPHSIQMQQRQMQHAASMKNTGVVQSPQKQEGFAVVPTIMPSMTHQQQQQQQNHRPSPVQLLQQQRHLALARTTVAMQQHAVNTTNNNAAARSSSNTSNANNIYNGLATIGSLSQSSQHEDILVQQQRQRQQQQIQQQRQAQRQQLQLQQRQQQMLNTKRASSALPATAGKAVGNNARSNLVETATARMPLVTNEAAPLSSASGSNATARSQSLAQSQSHAARLKGGVPGTAARVASTQQQQQHQKQSLSYSQQQHTQPEVEHQPQTVEQAQQSLYEEQIARQRSVLVDKYSPFIAPSDQSLKDARKRLRAALEQTRKLRCSFTKRVYGKYRVCLQPPETFEETIRNIKKNPKAVAKQLEQEIRLLKDEKELEKKEAQALNAELSKVDQSKLSVSADNAEQLMYLSAGLSLVMLPEDKVDAKLLKGYEDRGPINPATGQRVKSISQAAASAGEIILERSRKGAAMRKQWQRQRKLPESNSLAADINGEVPQQQQYNPMDLLITPKDPPVSTAVKKPVPLPLSTLTSKVVRDIKTLTIPVAPAVSQQTLAQPRQAPVAALANEKSVILQPTANSDVLPSKYPPVRGKAPPKPMKRPSKMSTILNSAHASSAKFGKSRGGAGISVNISLSLNPTADELSLENSCRASTAALMARSVGTAQGISRASPQQRLRHPHPESSGGRQRASSATSAKRELATLAQNAAAKATGFQNKGAYAHTYLNLALPPLPTPMERRERKPLIVVDETRAASNARAKRVIRSVLENLKDSDSSGSSPASTRATKIDFLRGIHKSQSAEGMPKKGVAAPAERRIDPGLAFSVLQAIGLITEVDNERNETSPVQMESKVEHLQAGTKRKLLSLASLPATWRKISLSKRARFSDAVFNNRKLDHRAVPVARCTTAIAPLESIRGGGELPSGSADEATGSRTETDARKANAHAQGRGATSGNSVAGNTQPSTLQRDFRQQQSRWDDASRQSSAIMNSPYHPNRAGMEIGGHVHGTVAGPVPPHHQPSLGPNEVYRHQSSFNALQLVHQLRHANNAMDSLPARQNNRSPGDMQVSQFMSEPYHQAPWSPNGTSVAAMATAQASLAALGLQFPMGVYNAVQHRSARALLAREQQNVAAAQAVAAHQQSVSQSIFLSGAANPGFTPASSVSQPPHQGAPNFSSASQAYNARAPSSVISAPPAAILSQTELQNSLQGTSAANTQGGANDKGMVPPALEEKGGTKRKTLAHDNPSPALTRPKPKADDVVAGSRNNGVASLKTSTSSNSNLQVTPAKKRKDGEGSKAAISNTSLIEKAAVTEASNTMATQPGSLAAQPTEKKATIPAMNKKGGLQFFLPRAPTMVSPDDAKLVQIGRVHALLGDRKTDEASNVAEILAYLAAVGANIPIPKAFVLSALKDRLNIPGFKHLSTSAGFNFSREVCLVAQPPCLLLLCVCSNSLIILLPQTIAAVILVWLWNYHEEDFQNAFAKSGRIDVDPTCKWLVHAAVDIAARALTEHIRESRAVAAFKASKSDNAQLSSTENTHHAESSAATVVCRALTTLPCKSSEVVSTAGSLKMSFDTCVGFSSVVILLPLSSPGLCSATLSHLGSVSRRMSSMCVGISFSRKSSPGELVISENCHV